MTEPVRPNTEVTGTDTTVGVSHTGIPPDIERICPLAPPVRPIVFPTLESQLLNERILSLVATTHERVESCPERDTMLPVAVVRLLFVVLRFVVRVAMLPVAVARLELVVERFVLVVERFPERVAMLDSVVLTRPERDTMLPVAVARLLFVVLRLVVSVAMLPVAVARLELVVAIDPVMVAMFEFIPATVPLRAFCARRLVK